jgi:hypothetical protein
MHSMDGEAFKINKFKQEINDAYGSEASSEAPATDATLKSMVAKIPTLKYWSNLSGKPSMYAQEKYMYSQEDGISEAKTFTYDTDNYKTSTITFFKSSFASYRTLAFNMLHELGHAHFNYTGQLAPLIKKYGNGKTAQAYSEVYAFKFAFKHGGMPYLNNAWYLTNKARTN